MTLCMTSYRPLRLRFVDTGREVERAEAHERWLTIQDAVRQHNAGKLRSLVEMLEPYVEGAYGPVHPRMVEVYMTALRELGRLYRVFDPPPLPEAPEEEPESLEDEEPARVEGLRRRALEQLSALEGKHSGRRPR